jgi:calcineurin-like phosphoesterase family protein
MVNFMAQWFFVSDLHLGHSNIIKYCKRPFVSLDEESFLRMAESGNILYFDVKISQESTERMNTRIIDSINATVGSGDNLVILGDFLFH